MIIPYKHSQEDILINPTCYSTMEEEQSIILSISAKEEEKLQLPLKSHLQSFLSLCNNNPNLLLLSSSTSPNFTATTTTTTIPMWSPRASVYPLDG
ncbi:hypothetical protein L3X38_023690 [Prunus dulcis]|uniref:Uncharacterized protein n=1 Tax=Prunus dulcis TaxID=3755 RepID=A0AAD4VYH6_PRUDU|nr:hypothetical protein L3X38_023690 [Prunus dulcis]